MRSIIMFCLALLLANLTALAQSSLSWMSDDELRQTFAGKSIEGHYADGSSFKEIYNSDNRLKYIEGRRQKTGRWSVVAGTFCTIYDGTSDGGCFRVRRSSANCFEFYFQASDEQTARARDLGGDSPSWTARAWRMDVLSTCQEDVSG